MSAPFNKVFIRSRCCKDDLYAASGSCGISLRRGNARGIRWCLCGNCMWNKDFFFRILWIPTVLWTSCSYQEPFFWCSLEISQILSNVRIKRIRSDQLFNLYFGKISQIANWSSFHEYLAGNIPLFNAEMNFKRRLRFPRERLAPKWKLLIRRVSCM